MNRSSTLLCKITSGAQTFMWAKSLNDYFSPLSPLHCWRYTFENGRGTETMLSYSEGSQRYLNNAGKLVSCFFYRDSWKDVSNKFKITPPVKLFPLLQMSHHLGSSHSRVIQPLVLNVPLEKSRSMVRREKLISIRVRARDLLGILAPANIPEGRSCKTLGIQNMTNFIRWGSNLD